jgi:small subunit ribosomal protein S6
MALYESVFIARQDLSPAQVETLTGDVSTILKKQGAQVTKTEQWGLRTLAYRIKKNKKGHYVLLNIDGPADSIQEMERTMRINEDVLRYMTIRVDALEEGPSAVLRKRDEADEAPSAFGSGGAVGRGGRPVRRPRDEEEGEEA